MATQTLAHVLTSPQSVETISQLELHAAVVLNREACLTELGALENDIEFRLIRCEFRAWLLHSQDENVLSLQKEVHVDRNQLTPKRTVRTCVCAQPGRPPHEFVHLELMPDLVIYCAGIYGR
jgi:hypothetical protein